MARLVSLVGITERETGVGKLGWHGNSTGFDSKNCFFPYLRNKRKKKDQLTSPSSLVLAKKKSYRLLALGEDRALGMFPFVAHAWHLIYTLSI